MPVYQTRGGAAFAKITRHGKKVVVAGGNCFQAALASFFGDPLDAVPDFVNDLYLDDNWFTKVQEWTRTRHGVHIAWLGLGDYYDWDALPWAPSGPSIVAGKSKRGHGHVCVAFDGRVVHDPWCDPETGELGDGLVAVDGWFVFVPITAGE